MADKKREQWVVERARLKELSIMRQQAQARAESRSQPRPQARGHARRVTNTEIPVPTFDLPVTALALVRDVSHGGVQITTRSALEVGDAISFKLVGARGGEHILNGVVRHVSWNGGIGECTAGLAWELPTAQALEAWQAFLEESAAQRPKQTEDWIVLTGREV